MEISNKFLEIQLVKFKLFKSQNPKIGRYDVVFEIDGKLLYTHKNMLTLISDTFDSILSDGAYFNKVPIKIENYNYDDFYQFLTFLYSAQCQLSDSNIYSMIHIAEFYGVEFFKIYCKKYLSDIRITTENILKLMELADKYYIYDLKCNVNMFLMENFITLIKMEQFLKLKKSIIEEIVMKFKEKVKPEDLFQAVYNWSESQVFNKVSSNPNFNVNDAIKNEISIFLPYIYFRQMELKFLLEFVVSRGFIFSSYNELSNILFDRHSNIIVKVTNSREQTIYGNIAHDSFAIEHIKSLGSSLSSGTISCYWNSKCKTFPSISSSLKKREGIEWYLIYFSDGDIGVRRYSELDDNDYLLAETSGFEITLGCKIDLK